MGPGAAVRIFESYLALSEQGRIQAGDGPAVEVWPETAFPGLLQTDEPRRLAIGQATAAGAGAGRRRPVRRAAAPTQQPVRGER